MKKSAILKAGILLCSITLATWFVAYRAGYFSASDPPVPDAPPVIAIDDQPQMDTNTRVPHLTESELRAHFDSLRLTKEMMVLASSKSGKVFVMPPQEEVQINGSGNQTFMGSSKNDGIFEPQPTKVDSPIKSPENEYIRSSKSGDIFRPSKPAQNPNVNAPNLPPNNNYANKAPTPIMGSSKSGPMFTPKPDSSRTPQIPEHKE